MKLKHYVLTAVILCSGLSAWAQRWDNYKPDDETVKLTETNLPIVFLNVKDQQIDRDGRITARMKIIDNGFGGVNYGDTLRHPNQLINYEGFVALKYRGNSSFTNSDKKPYSFRPLDRPLEEGGVKMKVKILGMGKDNNWALQAPYTDKSMMRDMLSFDLARPWLEYVPQGKYCELILDGTYYGVYILSELVTKGKKRLNLSDPGISGDSLTGGYLVEVDRQDAYGFTSKYGPVDNDGNEIMFKSIYYQYKFPEYEDMVSPQFTYLQGKIDEMEKAFSDIDGRSGSSNYRQLIDVQSFIDFQLSMELAHNVDGYRLSSKLYKRCDTEDGRWKLSLWDMALGFGNSDYYEGWRTDTWIWQNNEELSYANDEQLVPFWWYQLSKDPQYVNELKARWKQYRNSNYSNANINAKIDSVANLLKAKGAVARNSQAWPRWGRRVWPNKYISVDFDDEIRYLKNWIANRLKWMDQELGYSSTAIVGVEKDKRARTVIGIYTLDGRRIQRPQKGINVIRYSDGTSEKYVH